MEEGGMTDLQFMCYTRLLLRAVEHIAEQDTEEKLRAALEHFRQELETDVNDYYKRG